VRCNSEESDMSARTNGKVFVDVGISLDGLIAGPNGRPGNPLGDDGTQIHEWLFGLASFREHLQMAGGETGPDDDIVRAILGRIGANVMGRRMFDEGEVGWPENAPFHTPVFVLTHQPRDPWVRPGGTTFYFVTDGFDSALEQARAAAGARDVRISGGADTIRQALRAGVVEELHLHLAPVLLREGVRLFDGGRGLPAVEIMAVRPSAHVTHLSYRVVR
jgi:dihydrofolate reductase